MKRSLSLILSICLVLTLFAGIVPAAGAITYTDVKKSDWSYDAIYYLTEKNVLAGDGTGRFNPTNKVTHIEFIKMIVAAFNLKATESVNYTDVPTWAKEDRYLEKAAAQGFLLDYARDFDFESKLTREEAVALLMRYLDLDEEIYSVSSSKIPDYSEISTKYRSYALTAVAAGVIKGDEKGNFNPGDVLTREQALQILYNAAGSIYTKSANMADPNGPKTNATINNSAKISGIAVLGNVYITEDVGAVYLNDCFIDGELFVRGKTEVVLEDCNITTLTVTGTGAELELDGETEIKMFNVLATSSIDIEEDAFVDTIAFKTGSRSSKVTGSGSIGTIGVNDYGISTSGVKIVDEYIIAKGYTATFDGVEYKEGRGTHQSTGFVSAYVKGSVNALNPAKSNITFTVTTSSYGTLYAVAWQNTETAPNANSIVSIINGNSSAYAKTSQTVTANSAVTFSLTVDGSYEYYNVGLVFVPYGVSISADQLTPYYNQSKITATSAALSTTALGAVDVKAPTWTLSTNLNSLTVTFDQAMYYKGSSTSVLQSLSSLSSYDLRSLISVSNAGSTLSNYTVSTAYSTATKTVLTITPSNNLNIGTNYTVSLSSALVNSYGKAPSTLTISVVAGSSASTGLAAPTLTCSSSTSSVDSNDYVYISIPNGADRVRYTLTVDGVASAPVTITKNTYVYFRNYSNATVITVEAYAVDASNNVLGETATGTYYLSFTPLIYVNGKAYAGTGNVAKVSSSYEIRVGTAGSNSSATAIYEVNGYATESYRFVGEYSASSQNVFTVTYVSKNTGREIATTSVTVVYDSSVDSNGNNVPTLPAASAPSVYSNENKSTTVKAGQSNNISGDYVWVVTPSTAGVTYSYKFDNGSFYTLPSNNTTKVDVFGYGLGSKQLTIQATNSNGAILGTWTYSLVKY